MNNRLALVTLVAFLAATIFVFVRLVLPGLASDAGYLQNNLAPEILGFCLEGLLFVGLFEMLSSWRDHKQKETVRRVLNGTLERFEAELNDGAITAVQSHVWSLRMDSSNIHHARASQEKLKTLEPFFESINRDEFKTGLKAFNALLDFLESEQGEPFKSIISLWAMTGFDAAKQARFEAFFPMAALDSPESLAKWSGFLEHFRACSAMPTSLRGKEFRSLGAYVNATRI